MGSLEYDLFISYARADDADGWVTALRDAIYADLEGFSSPAFRIFFDATEIGTGEDWKLRLREGLRTSRVLLVCLSPNYLRSTPCRWEWEEFARLQAHRIGGGDAVAGVYFVELGGDEQYDADVAEWRHEVERVQLEKMPPWFPDGVATVQDAEIHRLVTVLGARVYTQVQQAHRAKAAPGNLLRHNPGFVGRDAELRALRTQLLGGAVGVVTAVHGIGGMGKTELAVTYAHRFAEAYQGGTWQVDADGQTDLLIAVSALALTPELGVAVGAQDLADRMWLGRRVLARLAELTAAARAQNPATAACLLLLDNVSAPELLSTSQLGVLPQEPWLHVAVTTRLGLSDIGAAGSRGSVAMIEVGALDAEDAVALLREHQPARDDTRLRHEFSSAPEEAAAHRIVKLLDGYTLAIEQAAVYLGTPDGEGREVQPSRLLADLRELGPASIDVVGASSGAGAIRHKEKQAGAIVDQTLQLMPPRALAALGFACLLPPDSVPWDWLRDLTEPAGSTPTGLAALSGADDWASTRRILEGRRQLTPTDNPDMARLHRVLSAHFRTRLANPDTDHRLDTHLQQMSQDLSNVATPDTAMLTVTATALTIRLSEGCDQLAHAALQFSKTVQFRLDLTVSHSLATATLVACERLAAADATNNEYRRDVLVSLIRVGDMLAAGGDTAGALDHYTRSLEICERLAAADPTHTGHQRDVSVSLNHVGDMLEAGGDTAGALRRYTRALDIAERIAADDPTNTGHQRDVSVGLINVGEMLAVGGDTPGALNLYTRALHIREQLTAADPSHTGRQRDVSYSLSRVGDVLAAVGNSTGALDHYTRALHIRERLAAADPTHSQYQGDVASSLGRVGDMLVAAGDLPAALEHYTRALHIRERLAAANPTHTGHQREVASSLSKVGTALKAGGDTPGALDHYTRVLHICERLAAADPTHSQHHQDVARSLHLVGKNLKACGDTPGALNHFTRALHICEGLAAADPTHTEHQRGEAHSLLEVGDILVVGGDTPGAVYHYTRALHIFEDLAAADPTHTQRHQDVAETLDRVGEMLVAGGDTPGALNHYTRALHIFEDLAAADPTQSKHQRNLWVGPLRVASRLESVGDPTASEYWAKTHRALAALHAAGTLPDSDRMYLDYVAGKVGPR